jgi:hypothetical protein
MKELFEYKDYDVVGYRREGVYSFISPSPITIFFKNGIIQKIDIYDGIANKIDDDSVSIKLYFENGTVSSGISFSKHFLPKPIMQHEAQSIFEKTVNNFMKQKYDFVILKDGNGNEQKIEI